MEQLERIRTMEEKLNAALAAIASLETALDGYRDALPCIRDLETYLACDEWRQDFEADEQGRLPAGLRRGVLSEDGIYNMLEANTRLLDSIGALPEEAAPRRAKEYRLVESRLGEAEALMNEMACEGWEVAGTALYPGGMALTKAATQIFLTFARERSDG